MATTYPPTMTQKANIYSNTFPSSSSNATYTAKVNVLTDEDSCNCKGWTFKKGNQPRTCKHTKILREQLGLSTISANNTGGNFVTTDKIVQKEVKVDTAFEVIIPTSPTPSLPSSPSPMLASAIPAGVDMDFYNKSLFVLEEKMDGHRILVTVKDGSVLASARPRLGNQANTRTLPSHIVSAMQKLPNGIYDGELYLPGGTSTDVVKLDIQDQLEFSIFDILETNVPVIKKSYKERRALLEDIFWIFEIDPKDGVGLTPQYEVSKKAVEAIWERGGEGAILKNIESDYVYGQRSTNWIKIKKSDSEEWIITSFTTGKTGPNSIAKLQKDNLTTTIKVLNSEILADINLDPDKYIGKKLVISFMGKTTNGLPKHAVWDHVL